MTTTGRHRREPSALWTVILASVLFGVVLGAGGVIVAESAVSSPAPRAVADAVTPSSTPTPSPEPSRSVESSVEALQSIDSTAAASPSVGLVAFAEPATSPTGLSLTVLPPEKIKGGVLLTIALLNTTGAPLTVDTGELGPRDPRFNGAAVPIAITPVTTTLVPGEGYTYQCVINLPTVDVGQLELTLGPVTVSGAAAGE